MLKRYNTGVDSLGAPTAESKFRVYKNCRSTRPAWNSDKPSVFRILPGADPENPSQFDRFMLDDLSFGNWLFVVPQVNFAFGRNGVSFALQSGPDDTSWNTDSPYAVLYSAIKDYSKLPDAPRSVIDVVESKDPETRLLPAPQRNVIMATIPFYRDGKDIQTEGKETVEILTVSESSFLGLSRHIRNQWNTGNQLDMTDPNSGYFLCMWNKEKCNATSIPPSSKIVLKGTFGYDMALLPTFPVLGSMYDGSPARLTATQLSEYRSMMRPIHEYVNYMCYSEQAELICRQVEKGTLPAWMVMYAFEAYPEWISQGVRIKAQREGSARTPGYRAPETVSPTAVRQPGVERSPYQPNQVVYQQTTAPRQPAPTYNPAPQAPQAEGTAYTGMAPSFDFGGPAPRQSFGSELQSQILNAAEEGMNQFTDDDIPF